MNAALMVASIVFLFVPGVALVMALRHFVPLLRGFKGSLGAATLGPLLLLSDRWFEPGLRAHRLRFLGWSAVFSTFSLVLFFFMEHGRAS